MITDYQRYSGSVLTKIIDNSAEPMTLERACEKRNGFYIINNKLPILIKYCKSRKGPWTFNYKREHQIFYRKLVVSFGDCITAYVCGTDGVPAVKHTQTRQFMDSVFENQECVSIFRKHNQMYSIRGRDGELKTKIARDNLFAIVSEFLSS